jgi:hypothetical protein
MIGLYGPIFFHSGTTGLSTFDAMKKTVTARWGDHALHLAKPLLEYGGPQLIEISFKMELIKPFTVDPLMTIVMLEEIMDLAIPLPLIIGVKPMGRGLSLFVLTSLSHEMKYFYRGGGLLGASVDVQLKEYPMTPQQLLSSLKQALGGVFGGGATTPTGTVTTGPLTQVGTDANAGTLPDGLTAPDQLASGAAQAQTAPLTLGSGTPVDTSMGLNAAIATPAEPPPMPEAQALTLGSGTQPSSPLRLNLTRVKR